MSKLVSTKIEIDVFTSIAERLNQNGLSAEVVFFALKYMKENPSLSIQDAFELGCTEWDI